MSMELAVQVWKLNLDKTAAFVLMALCDSADDDGTGCFAKEDYLLWKTGTSRATFYRTLGRLQEQGIIQRVTHSNGRVETIITLDAAPRKRKFVRKSQSQNETPQSQNETPQSQNETAHSNCTHPIYPTHIPILSLAPDGAAGSVAIAPQPSGADPKRVALTAALARYPQYFGMPRSRSELMLWNKRITSLLEGGLTPADVPRAVNAWKRKYPSAQLTINALDNRLGELLPAPMIPTPTPAPQAQEETPHESAPDAPRREPIPIRTQEEVERARIEADERRAAATRRAREALAEANRRASATQVVSRGARLAAAPVPPLQM